MYADSVVGWAAAPVVQATNTAGSQTLTHTFTVNSAATWATVRLYNGASSGNGDVWWDDVVMVEGPYTGGYFDGSKPDAQRINLIPSPNSVNGNGWFDAHGVSTTFSTNNAGGPLGTPYARSLATGTATGSAYFMVIHGSTNPSYYTPVTAGRTYTASLYVRVTMANLTQQPHLRFRWKNAAGSTISDQPLVYTTGYVSGTWVRLSSTGVAPAGAVYTEVSAGYVSLDQSTITVGDSVDVSAVLVEEGSTLGTYFDGSTTAANGTSYTWSGTANASPSIAYSSDFTYAWAGTANASQSYQKAISLPNWGIENKLISYTTSSGTLMTLVKDPNGGGGRSIVPYSSPLVNLQFTPGKKYTVVARGRKLDSTTGYRLNGSASYIEIPFTTSMSTQTVTFTATANTILYIEHTAGSNTAGLEMEYFGVFEEGDPISYFDGDTSGTEGLVTRWKGTQWASQSEQIGASVSSYVMEPNMRQWALPDGGIRTVNISGTTHSLQTPECMIVGRVYTLLVRARSYRSGNFRVYGMGNAQGSSIPVTLTASYAWYRVTGTASSLRLYLSSQGLSGSGFDISHMMVVEGTYTGGYLDGSSYGSRWEGNAHAATSLGLTPSLEALAGMPLVYVTTANSSTPLTGTLSIGDPRTIYSIVDNLTDVTTGALSNVLTYGADSLNDAIDPDKTIIIRQASQEGAFNQAYTRRTGGGGAGKLDLPSTGRHILIGGMDESGFLFSGFDFTSLAKDSYPMQVPHQRLRIEPNTANHSHVATYIFAGVHDDTVRAEVIKALALKHNVPIL
jgi:hypothetical protein